MIVVPGLSRITRPVLLCVALVFLASTALAGDPEKFVKRTQGQLTELLTAPESPKTERAVEGIFDRLLDYDRLARESLGDNWDKQPEAERQKFKDLFRRLVQRAYRANLKKTLDYSVTYEGEAKEGDSVKVKTIVKSRANAREEPISIVYRLHQKGQGWKVFDVITERSSLLLNYKRQFARVLKKEGWSGLIARMEKKLAEG